MTVPRPSSEAELRDAVRSSGGPDVRADDASVALTGAGRAAEAAAGASPGARFVATERMDAVLELRARDFTVTVEPGLRVARLREVVAEQGLWLAAGGPGAARSVGGWVAAATPGPWDGAFGPVRRQLLACRVATGDGRLLSWGRPVVKNVAGYDLPRLMAGSRGRLGALARLTLRLWPRPAALEALEIAGEPERLAAALPAVEAAGVEGLAWLWTPGSGHRLRAMLAGSGSSVARRREEVAAASAAAGLTAAETSAEPDPPEGDSGPRSPASLAFRWTPGRRYLARGLRSLAEGAGPRPVRIEAWPATGALVATFQDVADPVALLPDPDAGPVTIERGGRHAHVEADRRRPPHVRDLEARVLSALGGRPRLWQSDYA